MSNDVNVYDAGGIEARLTADTSDFDRSMDASEQRVTKLGDTMGAVPANIQKLIIKEQELSRQMQAQRQKIAEMDAALDAAKATYADMQIAVGRYSDADMAQQFAKEDAAIKKEEVALEALAQKLRVVNQQQDEAVAKINNKSKLSEQQGQYKTTSLAIDAVANSLRGLSPIVSGTIGNVGNLAERIVFLKQSMNAAKTAGASAGAVMGAAISGGVTLAISAISMLVSAIQQAEEEEQKAYEQAMKHLQEQDEKMVELQKSLNVLDSNAVSTSDMVSARERLVEIFPDLLLGYNEENEMILDNNAALKEQVETMREKSKLAREDAAQKSEGKFDDYKDTESKVASLEESIAAVEKEIQRYQDLAAKETGATLKREYEDRIKRLTKDLQDFRSEWIDAKSELESSDIWDVMSAKISVGIENYDELNAKQKIVYQSMINNAKDYILSAKDETEANNRVWETIKKIKSVLADEQTYTDRYNVIISSQAGTDGLSSDQLSAIDDIGKEIMEKLKEQRKAAYDKEVQALEEQYSNLYDTQKAALEKQYKATETSIKNQQNAYQNMSFDVKTLDEQDLANKMRKWKLQLAAEKDMYSKSTAAIQERYYKEVQLIVQTANKEIQVYKAKLAALDQADKEAEEARKARQEQATLRDLGEQLAKQEADNTRDMAEALEKYEAERDKLQKVIDSPPTQTARVLAERELSALNESWLKERQQLEAEHAEKILKIQRELDEERLTQQEDAAAAARDKQREALNQQVTDAENAAKQKLTRLNDQYAVEVAALKQSLSTKLEVEKEAYQQRLTALKKANDKELAAAKEKAKKRYEDTVSEETLVADARKQIMSKSYDEMMDLLDDYAERAKAKGKNFGVMYNAGLQEGLDTKKSIGVTVTGNVIGDDLKRFRGYATGGIVNSKQLAWVAEDEPEAIIPMSKMHDFVNGVLSGSQEVMRRAWAGMQRMRMSAAGAASTSQVDQSRTVHIENVNISRMVDFDLAKAQVSALMGGRR